MISSCLARGAESQLRNLCVIEAAPFSLGGKLSAGGRLPGFRVWLLSNWLYDLGQVLQTPCT
jgi:hypothetical protein